MPDKNIDPYKKGFFGGLITQIKLVIRLMKDQRINPLLKVLPFAGVLYFVFPDLLIGPIDDAAILLGGSYLFIEFCPPGIVAEHVHQLQFENRQSQQKKEIDENIVDGEFRDIEK